MCGGGEVICNISVDDVVIVILVVEVGIDEGIKKLNIVVVDWERKEFVDVCLVWSISIL